MAQGRLSSVAAPHQHLPPTLANVDYARIAHNDKMASTIFADEQQVVNGVSLFISLFSLEISRRGLLGVSAGPLDPTQDSYLHC